MFRIDYKRVILLIFIFLFIVSTPALLLYSAGYSFSLKYFRFIKTGNFLISSEPGGAKLLIDDKSPLRRHKLLFYKNVLGLTKQKSLTPTLVDRLLPGFYTFSLEKEGYQIWQKRLEIKEGETTFAKNIQLFLKKPEVKLASQKDNILLKSSKITTWENNLLSIKGDRLLILDSSGKLLSQINALGYDILKNKLLYFNDFELGYLEIEEGGRIKDETLTRISQKISSAIWHHSLQWVIYSIDKEIWVLELDNRDKRNIFKLISLDQVKKISRADHPKYIYLLGEIEEEGGSFKIKIQ